MTTITKQVHINAPKERVWQAIADLGAVVNFHPFVTHSYYTSQQKAGNGSARVCEFGGDFTVAETAIDWQEGKQYTLAVEVTKGPKPPIRDTQGIMSVKADSNGTLATITISYQPRFGLIGQIMDRLMVRPRYETMVAGILPGLKHYIETGETVDVNILKRIQTMPLAA